MVSVDTNVLARWMIRDVPKQAEVVDRLLQKAELLFVDDIVFFELEHLMRSHYQMPRDLVAAHFWTVINSKQFDLDRAVWRAALTEFEKHPSLSLADCYLACSAEVENRQPLLTFDKTLAKKLPKLVAMADDA